jgi:uncharacterized protein YjbI with pentapeptide repeats
MNTEELNKILSDHKKWLNNEIGGKRADLRGANLQRANLRGADLQGANLQGASLQGANLQGANLQGAYLQEANLQRANLQRANLQRANLDFSCIPLWCGSFNMKVDDNILEQVLTHIKMFDVIHCSKENQKLVKSIPESVKDKLKKRHDLHI